MSKVFLCGDPHGEFDHILSAIDQWHPDAVLILGDLTPSHSLDEIFKGVKGTKIYWIPGNHDTDSDLIYDRLWRSSFAKHNLHGRVQNVCGVKVAGLGGVFRGQIWMPPAMPLYASPSLFIRKIGKSGMWRGGLPRRHRSTIFQSVYEKLKECKADILITHEAPSMHPKGFKALDDLAMKMGCKIIFHAHQHESKRYCPCNGLCARGIGLRGIIDLEGNVIVPAQVDPRELETKVQSAPSPVRAQLRRTPASKFRRLNRFNRFSRKGWSNKSPKKERQG